MSDILTDSIIAAIEPGASVIDIGSGVAQYHPRLVAHAGHVTMLDGWLPYFKHREIPAEAMHGITLVCGDILNVLPRYRVEAFDVALLIDVVEHFDEVGAVSVLRIAGRIARRVVAFIPDGNHPQDKDVYGTGNDHYQTHRSTWDLENVSKIKIGGVHPAVQRWENFHASEAVHGKDPHAIWAIWDT